MEVTASGCSNIPCQDNINSQCPCLVPKSNPGSSDCGWLLPLQIQLNCFTTGWFLGFQSCAGFNSFCQPVPGSSIGSCPQAEWTCSVLSVNYGCTITIEIL